MTSMSTRFDYDYKVEMNWYAVGRHVLTTSFMSTWKILGTMYNLLICYLIVYSQESGELNYPVPWALNIVGLSWWSGARTRPLPYPYPLVGIDSGGRPPAAGRKISLPLIFLYDSGGPPWSVDLINVIKSCRHCT